MCRGVSHKIVVIDQQSLQPLKVMMEVTAQVDELKYSPAGEGQRGARDGARHSHPFSCHNSKAGSQAVVWMDCLLSIQPTCAACTITFIH
jgi:hypothetical protein